MIITNISRVTDNAGETPVVTYSNRVTTVIRQSAPTPTITRVYTNVSGACCCCRNGRCNCCACSCCQCNCGCCD